MSLAWLSQISKRLYGSRSRGQTIRRKPRPRPLTVEALEDRCVPSTVAFSPAYGAQQTSNGGDVLTGNVPVYLIFAGGPGAHYGYDGTVTAQQLKNAVSNILSSSYLSGLSEYGAATQAYVARTYVSNVSLSGSPFDNIVSSSINDNGGSLPEPDDTDTNGIWMVFLPTGVSFSGDLSNALGFHTWTDTGGFLDGDTAYYGVLSSGAQSVPVPLPTANEPASQVKQTMSPLSALDSMTVCFSHELVETLTDPDTSGGVMTTPTTSFAQNYPRPFLQSPGEICDNEAEFYGSYENGMAVQAYWSAQNRAFIVPGGTARNAGDQAMGSAARLAFEKTLSSVQYASGPTTASAIDTYALDSQGNLWQNFGYEWTVYATGVRSYTLFGDTPMITYINDPPTPQTPFVGQAVTTTTPTFTWAAVSGATSYSVSVIDAQTHAVVASASSLTTTSWTPSTPLVDGRGYQWQVQAYTPFNGSLVASKPSSPIYFFVNVSGALTLTSPAQGSTVTTSTPTLQWTPIPGAFTFKLSLYDVTTGTPVVNTPGWTIETTSFSVTVPLPSGHEYQWTVTGDDSAHTTASATFTIAVPSATSSLPAPTLSGPSGLVTTGTPTFQWSAVPGAAGYGLYIFNATSSNAYSWSNPILVSGTSYTPTSTLNNGFNSAYVWWVTAYDNAGNVSPVSQSQDIGIAVPSQWVGTAYPAGPNGPINTLTPTFQWMAVSGAEGYYLSVVDETEHTVAFSKYVTGATSYTLGSSGGPVLQNAHTYRWYIAALTINGLGPASLLTFTTAFPSTPAPLSPGGLQSTTTPTLQWSASTGATGYYLTLTDQTTGRTLLDSLSLTATSYTVSVPLSASDMYQWQARAYDGTGNVSTASAPVTFTVTPNLAAPALVSLASPVPTATPTLQWSAVANAAGYNVHLLDTTTNTATVVTLAAPTTQYTAAPLTDGHSYSWWVVAFDSAGNLGPAPAALTFTVQLLPTPTPLTPSGVTTGTPTLQWSPVAGASGYVVEILDVTGKQPLTVLKPTSVSDTSYTPSATTVDGNVSAPTFTDGHIYQWQVRAVDTAGNPSAWTSPVPFTEGADESRSTLAAGTTSLTVGDHTTITLTARDANGNPEKTGGLVVHFGLGSGSGQGTLGSVQDDGDGTYSVTFTATATGSVTVTATIDGQAVSSTAPTLSIVGPVSLDQSTVALSTTPITAGATATVTLTVRDAQGNQESHGGLIVVFGLGSGSGRGTFSAVQDNGDGTYTATLTATTAGSNTITATIGGQAVTSTAPSFNVVPGTVSLSQSTVSVTSTTLAAGATATVTLTARDAQGNQETSGGLTVAFGVGSGGVTVVSGGGNGNGRGTFGPVRDNGDGTYSATFTATATGIVTLTATIGGQAVTGVFPKVLITPGAASRLVFLVSPVGTAVGQPLAAPGGVQVAVEDGYDNVVTTDGSTVKIALGANPGSARLGGSLSVAAVRGVATFTDLTVSAPGGGYTLVASDGRLTSATSSPFDITASAPAPAFVRQLGATGSAAANATAVDAAGNVYLAGYFIGKALGMNSGGREDGFVAKYDAAGNLLWARDLGAPILFWMPPGPIINPRLVLGSAQVSALALDAAGNVYVTGRVSDTVRFGNALLIARGSQYNAFAARLNSDGTVAWAETFGAGSTDAEGNGIAVSATGSVYLTGQYSGTGNFNPQGTKTLTASGGPYNFNVFVIRLNTSGAFSWAESLGVGGYAFGEGIGADAQGNVYLTGGLMGREIFSPTGWLAITSGFNGRYQNAFVAKLAPSGKPLWIDVLATGGQAIGVGLAVDAAGNVYTTGEFVGGNFNPHGTYYLPSSASGGAVRNAYVSKLDTNGKFVWARALGGGSQDTYGLAIAVDAAGKVTVAGEYSGTGNFNPNGSTTLTSSGGYNAFVTQLDAAGHFAWAKSLGAGSQAYGRAVAVARTGAVAVAGSFQGTGNFDPGSGVTLLTSPGTGSDAFLVEIVPLQPAHTAIHLVLNA
jgi:hypothetical protein